MSLIANQDWDGLLISGDIAEKGMSRTWLQRLVHEMKRPIYFVLGNHDFYGESIPFARQETIRLCREQQNLHYLTDCSPIRLMEIGDESSPPTYLVGDDGWGDATTGDFERSFVKLADFDKISDFMSLKPHQQKAQLQELGLHSAQRLTTKLQKISEDDARIIVLTHVPPFVESCWYEGKTADQDWSPFFVCGQTGDALRSYASKHPNRQIIVLCGHCHHAGVTKPLNNLVVYTAEASIGNPSVAGKLDINHDSILLNSIRSR